MRHGHTCLFSENGYQSHRFPSFLLLLRSRPSFTHTRSHGRAFDCMNYLSCSQTSIEISIGTYCWKYSAFFVDHFVGNLSLLSLMKRFDLKFAGLFSF